MPKPKAILPPKWNSELFPTDNQWARLRRYIPELLWPEDEARLRKGITAACSWLLTEEKRLALGRRTAAAMQKPGKGQPALLEVFRNHLRAAADSWKEITERGVIYDDRLSDIRQYDVLEAMARDAERWVAGIRGLGEAEFVDDPFPTLVRKVAQCFREIGLRPTATGRVYDEGGEPTWFQDFIVALDKNLLGYKKLIGINREGKQYERPDKAVHAEIAKAMGGYGNPGKARKQITGR
jgi:hypothetical protein